MIKSDYNDITENKLILLFILDKVNLPLTNIQITEIIMKDSLMNYFVLQQYLLELVNINQVKICEEEDRQVYMITPDGQTTLSYFENRIPFSIKEKIQLELTKKKLEFKKTSEIISNYMPVNQNEYMVDCKIIEQSTSLIELKLIVGTKEEAKNICRHWNENSQKVYSDIISIFTSINTPKKGENV
ncbi:MAG: DUF4364 family protein [Clostridia bacterium]